MAQRVAILMATFNGADWVGEQIQSLLAQTHQNWHLFVSDDGSNDSTIEIIRNMLLPDRVTVLPSSGISTGSPAANFLNALCRLDFNVFDYLALADQDDIWAPKKLELALHKLRKFNAEGYSSNLIAFNDYTKCAWYIDKSKSITELDYMFQGASAGCTYVLTRSAVEILLKRITPHVENLPNSCSHDWLIYAICRSHGLVWHMDPQSFVFYRQHKSNSYGALHSWAGLKVRLRLIRNGWYRDNVLWLRNFLLGTTDEQEVFLSIARLSTRDRFFLAINSRRFRRKKHDRWLLAFSFLVGWF